MRPRLRVLRGGGDAGPAAPAPGRRAAAEGDGDEPRYDWLDVVALTIAAFQILLPVVAAFCGVVLLLYLLLRWWAG